MDLLSVRDGDQPHPGVDEREAAGLEEPDERRADRVGVDAYEHAVHAVELSDNGLVDPVRVRNDTSPHRRPPALVQEDLHWPALQLVDRRGPRGAQRVVLKVPVVVVQVDLGDMSLCEPATSFPDRVARRARTEEAMPETVISTPAAVRIVILQPSRSSRTAKSNRMLLDDITPSSESLALRPLRCITPQRRREGKDPCSGATVLSTRSEAQQAEPSPGHLIRLSHGSDGGIGFRALSAC